MAAGKQDIHVLLISHTQLSYRGVSNVRRKLRMTNDFTASSEKIDGNVMRFGRTANIIREEMFNRSFIATRPFSQNYQKEPLTRTQFVGVDNH